MHQEETQETPQEAPPLAGPGRFMRFNQQAIAELVKREAEEGSPGYVARVLLGTTDAGELAAEVDLSPCPGEPTLLEQVEQGLMLAKQCGLLDALRDRRRDPSPSVTPEEAGEAVAS